ncbi:hypothetical protein A3F36_04990 [Candidatus Peribacteria bacterium RIFCSPHIGHO2_12_FULL_55_11]|nr:MAG: hypothetical protein A3F36_04990 [Candidatus Peribacteria bacterium RIFCSPHIGHO2_12_FULL_55_11]
MDNVLPIPSPVPPLIRKSRLAKIRKKAWWFAYDVKQAFYQLLRVDLLRLFVTAIRYVYYVRLRRRLRTLDSATGDIGHNTVFHNKLQMGKMKHLGGNRSGLLAYPLSAIHISRSSPVLCIGPRSEGELLNLMGMGFRNVRGLDLISYSPWIDLGDMHAMPYADNAFGIVTMGWVLAYSHAPTKAALEAVRVTRNGGLIAGGGEFRLETAAELAIAGGYEVCDIKRLESVAEILSLFAPHVDRVFFTHDVPSPPQGKWQLLVIFSVKK